MGSYHTGLDYKICGPLNSRLKEKYLACGQFIEYGEKCRLAYEPENGRENPPYGSLSTLA